MHDLSIHTPSDYRLLPEVRTLDIHLDAVNGPEGVDMLLGPRLDAISVRITGMDAGLRWTMVLFSQMFAVCRGLRTLKADLGDCHAEMMCVVLDALRAARPPLTTLHLGVQNRIYAYGFSDSCMTTPNESMERLLRAVSGTVHDFSTTVMISPFILPSFSLFRNLQNLVVYVRPPEPSSRSTRLSLPSLRSLEIIADHIFRDTPPWLRWLEAEHLHTLAIFSRERLDDSCGKGLRDFNVSLLMCSLRKTLQVVSIHTRELSYEGWRPPYNVMRPLLALPKLSALYLPRRWVAEGVLETLAEDRPGIQLLEHCPIHPRAFPDIPDVPLSRSELWSIP